VTFVGGVTSAGAVSATATIAASPPPTGYQIVGLGPFYWDIDTTAAYTPPVRVCISYDPALVPYGLDGEPLLQLFHFEGGIWKDITTDRCLSNACADTGSPCTAPCSPDLEAATLCGSTTSLSPFAMFQRIDATGPVLSGVPGDIVAPATSTSGATVSYPLPTAVDETSGVRSLGCTPASGSQFAPGKTTVTCTPADRIGNTSTASFVVWVQYEAPGDGSFFLKPIRPDGSSVFCIGRTVPVKFKLTGASKHIADLQAHLGVTKISDVASGNAGCERDEDGEDTDFLFKHGNGAGNYAYRWKTRGGSSGTYRLSADLGDEVVHEVDISLKGAR
jgi:hypothetical protein